MSSPFPALHSTVGPMAPSVRVDTSLCVAMGAHDRTPPCPGARCNMCRSMSSDSLMAMRERESVARTLVGTAAAQGTSMRFIEVMTCRD